MTTLIVDGNNVVMRAIHAMARSPLSADGVATGPLLVFINSISRHVREEQPDKVVVCWDSGPSEFRVALDPAYKAHRAQADPAFDEAKRTHFGLAKEFLALANIHQVERPGYEADDLIAWYWWATPREEKTVILSSDKDFLQLVDRSTEQVRLSAGGAPTDRWTLERVREEFGCEPDQLALAMALAGDASDGVPGVPRFGMKTAIKHLTKHEWDLDAAIEHPKVVEHRDQVEVALQLVDLRTPRPELVLPTVPVFSPTISGSVLYEGMMEYLVRYRMDSIKARVHTNTLWRD